MLTWLPEEDRLLPVLKLPVVLANGLFPLLVEPNTVWWSISPAANMAARYGSEGGSMFPSSPVRCTGDCCID